MAVFSSMQNTAACRGGVQVKPDDVGCLGLEVGVIRRHVARQPAPPQVGLSPDALYDVLLHAEVGREALARPSASSRPAAGGVWRQARGRAGAPSTSTAAGPGWRFVRPSTPCSRNRRRQLGDGPTRDGRSSSPPPARERCRREAARSWRAGRIRRARRSSGAISSRSLRCASVR